MHIPERFDRLETKIIFPLGVIAAVLAIGIYFFFSTLYRDAKQQELVSKARALVVSAESAREYAARQHSNDVFRSDLKDLKQILHTVPVFAAIQVAGSKAAEMNYDFKVPKFSPRNPQNQPDEDEARVLRMFESGSSKEHWEEDVKTNTIRYYRPIRLTKECLDCHGDPARSAELWGNPNGLDPTGVRMENWKEGEVHGAFEVKMALAPLQADVAAKSRTIALISILGGLLMSGAGFAVARYIAKPIKELTAEAQTIAEGDLTVDVTYNSKDEVGQLASSFRTMVTNLRTTIGHVSEATSSVASASAEISSSSEQMAAGAHEQSSQSNEVAAAVEEMTKTIIENSKSATTASETASRAKHAAEDGGRVVAATKEGMQRIADVVRESSGKVQELGKSSSEIGVIINVIDEIAEQTNLLALNAAIEAARAGEQGRGFAVVADEVRKLAERTTKATKEIAEMIVKIQKDTTDAVQSMKQGTQHVNDGMHLADKASKSLQEIVGVSQEVNQVITQIAAANEQQSATSEQIARNVEGISAVTGETAQATQQLARAAEDLNQLTENLQHLVGFFKLSAKESSLNAPTRKNNIHQHTASANVHQKEFGKSRVSA